jgi:hypothetical protein
MQLLLGQPPHTFLPLTLSPSPRFFQLCLLIMKRSSLFQLETMSWGFLLPWFTKTFSQPRFRLFIHGKSLSHKTTLKSSFHLVTVIPLIPVGQPASLCPHCLILNWVLLSGSTSPSTAETLLTCGLLSFGSIPPLPYTHAFTSILAVTCCLGTFSDKIYQQYKLSHKQTAKQLSWGVILVTKESRECLVFCNN